MVETRFVLSEKITMLLASKGLIIHYHVLPLLQGGSAVWQKLCGWRRTPTGGRGERSTLGQYLFISHSNNIEKNSEQSVENCVKLCMFSLLQSAIESQYCWEILAIWKSLYFIHYISVCDTMYIPMWICLSVCLSVCLHVSLNPSVALLCVAGSRSVEIPWNFSRHAQRTKQCNTGYHGDNRLRQRLPGLWSLLWQVKPNLLHSPRCALRLWQPVPRKV